MKVFITGGTGFVGSYLSKELAQQGLEITILPRGGKPPSPPAPGAQLSRPSCRCSGGAAACRRSI
jgi:nucleoside-diphosphate-sugar epimerase